MTCYIFNFLNRDMVRGRRSGRVSTSIGRGSTRIGTTSPSTPVVPSTGTASPSTPVIPPMDRLPDPASSVTFPIPITTRGREPSVAQLTSLEGG
ncbi:hypothetical protein Taro_045475 [Colocasia esculenta]|uniref:Uncharacterized protein n=1 Tax=Colocasia esculenta TaxID=4460 RepID=A0A843WX59_COLES|nr:hypothetical protein [Colocasia esculenta]